MAFSTFSSTKSLINKGNNGLPELTGLINYYLFNTADLSSSAVTTFNTNMGGYSSGSLVYDSILSSTAAINTTTYKYGTGSLDASGYYLKINNNPVTGSSGVSVSFWMKANGTYGYLPLFDFGNVSAAVSNTISMALYGNRLSAKVSTSLPTASSVTFSANTKPFSSIVTLTNPAGIAVNQYGNIMVCADYQGNIYDTSYNGSVWGTANKFYTLPSGAGNSITGLALTPDGSRGIFGTRSVGRIYIFTRAGSSYSTPATIPDTNTRDYFDVDLTADGNRMVACSTNGHVYYANWTGSTYNPMVQITSTSRTYTGCAITPDGGRVAYSEIYGNVYYRVWNAGAYSTEITINSTALDSGRQLKFTRNGSILYCMRNKSATSSMNYTWWTGTAYNTTFTSIPTSAVPAGLDLLGLNVSPDGGNVYYCAYGDSNLYKNTVTYTGETYLQNINTTNYNDNAWHNVTWTISSAGAYTFYVDNVSVYTASSLTYPTAILRGRNYIGYSYDLSLATFGGYIDDFRFYNSTLSVADVSAIYNNSSPPTANLLNYYKFDQSDISYVITYPTAPFILNKTTSTTYDASLSDTAMISTSSFVEGTAALNVTSATKSVKITSPINLGSSGFTVSFWLKSAMNTGYKPILNIGNGKYNNAINYGIQGNTIITDATSDVSFGAVVIDASSTILLNKGNIISIGATSDGKRLAVCTYETSGVVWNTILNNTSNSYGRLRPSEATSFIRFGLRSSSLSADGNVIVIADSSGNIVYTSRWINGNSCYGPFTQIDATTRNYQAADISADGSRIVTTVYAGLTYFSTWNGTAYTTLAQTTDGNTRNYTGVTISSDGTNLIALSETSQFTLHLSTWNGGNFAYKGSLSSGITTGLGRRCKLSYDNSVIFCSTASNGTASLYYTQWNGTSYNTPFTAVSTSYVPASLDAWGLAVDASNNVYVCGYGASQKTIYKLHFSLSKKTTNNVVSEANINDNTWRHHALTVSSAGTYKHYIDGGLVKTTTGVIPANISRSTNYIGYSVDLSNGDISGAIIDDFRIYNRVVSDNDISTKLYKPLRKVTGVVGGTLVSNSTYTLYEFGDTLGNRLNGSITISGSRTIYYVIVGGGGSSASRGGTQSGYHGAGGGGGGVVSGIINQSQTTTYNIIIGRGGASEAPSSNTTSQLYTNSPYAFNATDTSVMNSGAYGERSQIIYGSTVLYADGGGPSTTVTTAAQDTGGVAGTTTKGLTGVASVTETGAASNGGNGGVAATTGYTISIGSTPTTYNVGGGGSGGGTSQGAGVNTYGGGNGGTQNIVISSSGAHKKGGGGGGERGYNGSTCGLNFAHGGTGLVLIFFSGSL